MKKAYFLVIVFLAFTVCRAQNVVINGNFEQYSGCPYSGDIDSALNWFNPTSATPNLMNSCANAFGFGVPINIIGSQYANSGTGYSGVVTARPFTNINYREYISAQLASLLQANACYNFEMYISLGDKSNYTSADVGVYFSDTLIESTNSDFLPFVPQVNNLSTNVPDSLTWILVSGTYTATGNENYFIIGNFKDASNTTTTLVNNNNSSYDITYIYIDDVSLSLCTGTEEVNDYEPVHIYPNPFENRLNITNKSKTVSEIVIYDINSAKIIQQKFMDGAAINTSLFAKGVYIYEIRNESGIIKRGKILKK